MKYSLGKPRKLVVLGGLAMSKLFLHVHFEWLMRVLRSRAPRPSSGINQRQNTMNLTRNLKSVALAIAGVILIPSCATTGNANTKKTNNPPNQVVKSVEQGKASWYSIKTNRGTRTASGQRLCNNGATAAHKTLPMGTQVRVINTHNGASEIVTITDRGPYIRGRIIDVTIGTAERLGFRSRGVAPVKVEVLGHVKD
jgi:rare lipoprotein A